MVSTEATTDSGVRAGRKEWAGLALLALPTLVLALDMSVLYLASPYLGADLGPTSSELLWIMDIYGFMIAGFLVTMGTLGDRIGRRRLLLVGGFAFAVASIVAAYASEPVTLILARALLGIAGATLAPSTLALISNMFENAHQRTTAISVWIACFMSGMGIGPILGGVLLESFWWGSVFLLAVPVMVLLLILAPLLLPEYRQDDPGRLDLFSVALSLAAILPTIYGLKTMAEHGFGAEPALVIVAGAIFAVLFVRRQRRLDDPLVDVTLFRDRAFTAALVIILVCTAAGGGLYLFATQYLQMVSGLTPLVAGVWLVPTAIASVIGSLIAPPLARRFGSGRVLAGGLSVAVVGYLLMAAAGADSGLALVATGIALVFFGAGPMTALGTDLVVGSVPPEKAGSAASLSETSTELGISLGVALLGSVGTAVYRASIDGSLPGELGEDAAARSGDTLAGALASASDLSGEVAAEIVAAGRAAFALSLTVVSSIGALVVAILTTVAFLVLRDKPGV
ncbi:DHA2 family multidrug resistance protein-like MFS transporter [Nocardia alba]|uniref:DHA2 family multidrug resistance protein-like MFS transporter n=1 Tax=Nocardia alba TaxID=225051 RepID=A0A4R1FTT5_9NOCA|nr:DHA2 family multidrug resistance protein-like MFS transporter [Nocardia alba]